MKNSKLVSCLGILVVSGMLGCSVAQPSHQAFLNRTGETIEVSINGTPSKRTELKRWRDVTDTEVEQTHWLRRTSSGRLCFNVKPRTEEFGAFRQMGISIKEFRPDRPSTRWKNYLIKAGAGFEDVLKPPMSARLEIELAVGTEEVFALMSLGYSWAW